MGSLSDWLVFRVDAQAKVVRYLELLTSATSANEVLLSRVCHDCVTLALLVVFLVAFENVLSTTSTVCYYFDIIYVLLQQTKEKKYVFNFSSVRYCNTCIACGTSTKFKSCCNVHCVHHVHQCTEQYCVVTPHGCVEPTIVADKVQYLLK